MVMLDMRRGVDLVQARPSLVEAAYDALKEAIRTNVFAPGYQGAEQEIATQLGMSRTPVHEAIIRLQEEGLVRVLPRRGVVVCALSPDDMREVYEVIVALEGASAELLAEMSPDRRDLVVAELAGLNARMTSALAGDDLVAWAQSDEKFHQALVEGSGNGRLARMFHTIMDQSHRARMMTLRLRAKPEPSLRDHQAIIDAIKSGDPHTAHNAAKQHRVAARDQLLPLLGRFGMKHL